MHCTECNNFGILGPRALRVYFSRPTYYMLLFHHVATVLYLSKNKCGKVKQAVMKERDYHGTGGEIIMRGGVLVNNKENHWEVA